MTANTAVARHDRGTFHYAEQQRWVPHDNEVPVAEDLFQPGDVVVTLTVAEARRTRFLTAPLGLSTRSGVRRRTRSPLSDERWHPPTSLSGRDAAAPPVYKGTTQAGYDGDKRTPAA